LSLNPIEATAGSTPKRRLIGLSHLDNRTRAAKRALQITRSLQKQLGHKPTVQQRMAIENAACMQVISEDLRARTLAGECVSTDTLVRAQNVAARAQKVVLAMIGARRPKTPATLPTCSDE
jgi:hypothetical protein